MSEYENKYPENMKYFLSSKESKKTKLVSRQNKIIQNISKGQKLDEYTNLEFYNEIPYEKAAFIEKSEEILQHIPSQYFKDEFTNIIYNLDFGENDLDNLVINYGDRISLDMNQNIKFEEWRNILSNEFQNNILFSLHKVFIDDKYEVKITYKNETNLLELIIQNKVINSIKFTKIKGKKKCIYLCVPNESNTEIDSTFTFEDEDDKLSERKIERLCYYIDSQKKHHSKKEKESIVICQVDTESIKIDENSDYNEKNYETYNFEPDKLSSWGTKKYENNKGRKYNEEWYKNEFENNGYELKCHKFLDDGCGKKTTEDHGKKCDENNKMEYEYTDRYVYDVTNGDELTTKIGYDKYNKWNCKNYRNKIKDFSHVENVASNKKDKMEWKEKWDEEQNMKECTKWGRSEDEEWEEHWKEVYNPKTDDSVKECYKKCKKLKYDKEWYETWTEKNNGKPNCEKTCYKMNKENGNKFENYWGNIIVNYLDNKRMNYVGYINNDKKDEFVSYTYENTNN